jgi:MFS family permease
MGKRDIIFAGIATGTFVGILMVIITNIPLGSDSDGDKITIMYHWSGALLTVIGIPLVSAFSVKYGSRKLNCCEPSLKHLLPVAFLTCLPVLFSTGGAPNSSLEVLASIVLIGAVFGAFWSLPYVLLSHFKKTDSSESEDE